MNEDGEDSADGGGFEELLSIGAFARRVGLAPSALRFYDDCGVLRPARVDGSTGYRFYGPGQAARAVLVRRLREAGVPLVDASVVLDGAPDDAREVLRGHARRTRATARAAGALIEEILRGLPGAEAGDRDEASTPVAVPAVGTGPASARVGGPELAAAVRQVESAVAGGALREEFPVLGCVLVEWDGEADEVRLVATDRYCLVVRVLRAASAGGGAARVLVEAEELRAVGAWALRRRRSSGKPAVVGGPRGSGWPVRGSPVRPGRTVTGGSCRLVRERSFRSTGRCWRDFPRYVTG
ncbi:MerR family transcriptional regulator [Streptomyces sp. NPDC091272]|uniref:MerR family transcriptional regulator n=1 Tax=Streptomyces sp. NPDC091272 TaxID=3365981 RepID=UPI00382A862C